MTGEIIGKAFYALLHANTDDEPLRSVCGKLIRDEVQHVRLHADLLRERLDELGLVRRSLWRAQFRMTFRTAALGVWADHRRCFREYDVTFRDYWQKTSGMMHGFLRDASPKPALAPSGI